MKRLFIAIKVIPDKGFIDQFRMLKNDLRHERIKWVEENNIHITLKFLGETDEKLIPSIKAVLAETAASAKSFSFSLKDIGIFGSSYAPKVVWTGIQPYEEMKELMKRVHQDLRKAGFEPDRQNLVPHLTLGRIKFLNDKRLFSSVIEKYHEISSEPMIVREFHLYESILKREGPEYIVLRSFPLLAHN